MKSSPSSGRRGPAAPPVGRSPSVNSSTTPTDSASSTDQVTPVSSLQRNSAIRRGGIRSRTYTAMHAGTLSYTLSLPLSHDGTS